MESLTSHVCQLQASLSSIDQEVSGAVNGIFDSIEGASGLVSGAFDDVVAQVLLGERGKPTAECLSLRKQQLTY